VDRRDGTVESLPPLELRALRELDLDARAGEGGHAHVASASGVVARGDFVYVIGDELLDLAVFRLSAGEPGTLVNALAGDLPEDEDERKSEKADLEALTALPPFEGAPNGMLCGLGSGSGAKRNRGFVWPLAADGGLDGQPTEIDLTPVYDLLREDVPELNVEGAAVLGERLWLLHRGNHRDSRSVIAELSLADVMESIMGDRKVDPHELAAIRAYDLGDLDGVELAFSDATTVTSDLLVFTASAEAQGHDGPDGEIRGSVVGTIDVEGHVRRLRTIDRRYKVEGVDARVDTGVVDFLFVCDQDEDETASPLLSATMPLAADAGG
jgi:hypothetical protein